LKTLATPFRSPLMKKEQLTLAQIPLTTPLRSPLKGQDVPSPEHHESPEKLRTPVRRPHAVPRQDATPAGPSSSSVTAKLGNSSRATAQFKSPLASRGEGSSRASVHPTPEIQALERKLHTLKRAVKIKRSGGEDKLETLALKWRDAAREAAYDLWEIVRHSAQDDRGSNSGGGWGSSWGWNDAEGSKGKDEDVKMHEGGADEEPEKQEETVGIMLRRLGIDPATLGWSDGEETFVD
jgi:hypothetical protein